MNRQVGETAAVSFPDVSKSGCFVFHFYVENATIWNIYLESQGDDDSITTIFTLETEYEGILLDQMHVAVGSEGLFGRLNVIFFRHC